MSGQHGASCWLRRLLLGGDEKPQWSVLHRLQWKLCTVDLPVVCIFLISSAKINYIDAPMVTLFSVCACGEMGQATTLVQ